MINDMKKGMKGRNYNSHHCGNYKRKNIMGSPNSPLKCKGSFHYQNGMKGHWTCECCRSNNLTNL